MAVMECLGNIHTIRGQRDQLQAGGNAGYILLPRTCRVARRGRVNETQHRRAPQVMRVHAEARPAAGTYIGKLGSDSVATRTAASTSQATPPAPPRVEARAVFVSLAVAVALPVLGGVLVSSFASPAQDWYRDLDKPSWEPPDWIFGGMWSVLYLLMGVASWLVWADGGVAKQAPILKLYLLQLVVNYLWPIVFFKLHRVDYGLVVLGLLAFLVNRTLQAFHGVNRVAGWLMLPYLAWVLFALVLNFSIWRLNRNGASGGGGGGSSGTIPGATWSATVRPRGDAEW